MEGPLKINVVEGLPSLDIWDEWMNKAHTQKHLSWWVQFRLDDPMHKYREMTDNESKTLSNKRDSNYMFIENFKDKLVLTSGTWLAQRNLTIMDGILLWEIFLTLDPLFLLASNFYGNRAKL